MYKNISLIGLFTALLVIFSWISIPLPLGVPFTLQVFGIFLISFLLKKDAWKAVLIYLILGSVGLPVFSNFTGGINILLGPTGGFLIGFLAASLINLFIPFNKILLGLMQLIIIYSFGVFWFQFFNNISLFQSFKILVPLFIWWDILKLFMAYSIVFLLEKKFHIIVNTNKLYM